MNRYLRIFSLIALVILYFSSNVYAFDSSAINTNTQKLKLLRVTPSGEDVPPGRQIVFQFNRPVVPVGRMERDASEIPITIEPALDCQWRWLNTSALACRLGAKTALKPATRYKILIAPGIKTEDRSTLAEPVRHAFITERPKVRHAWFRTWKAPGMPIIRVIFNQPVARTSVKDHVFMMVYTEKSRQIPLQVEPDPDDKKRPFIHPIPREKRHLITGPEERSDRKEAGKKSAQEIPGDEYRRVWLVSPENELALDTKVELKVEPGLASFLG
ncbi:MAG: large extracellular alpha-helical protein, partial [Deltaproteobacteria bacterium]|nr:large extracellular alpha-helical protein [Deltaproteobacteria bacterium]